MLLVVIDDVEEDRDRLVVVVVATIEIGLEELHPDQLVVLGVLDVVDVDVERVEHLLLALGDRLRRRLGVGRLVHVGLLLDPRIDVERVLPAQHRGVGRLLHQPGVDLAVLDHVGERERGVLPQLGLHPRVLLALGARPDQLGVVVLGLRVVLGVGEHLEIDLVEPLGVGQRLGVLGLGRLGVVRARQLARHRGGVIVTLLGLGRRQRLARPEPAVQPDQILDLLDLVGVPRAGHRELGVRDVVLPQAHVLVGRRPPHQLLVGVDRAVALALRQVEVGEDLEHVERVRRVDALERHERLVGLADLGVGAHEVLLGRAVQDLLLLVVPGRLGDLVEHLERLLELLLVEVDPADLVHRVPVGRRLGELEHHAVARVGVVELADLEEVIGERQVRLGHVLRAGIVLEQLVVDAARLLHVLAALQREPVIEQRHVHLRVVAERLVVGEALVGLHRLDQELLGLGLGLLRVALELGLLRRDLVRVGGDRHLGALEPPVALLLGVQLAEPEVVIGLLLELAVRRLVDQVDQDRLLLGADLADQALDREHLVGAERQVLLLLVLGVLGHDRLDAIGQLDVDLDVALPRVLGPVGPGAGGRHQHAEHREVQLQLPRHDHGRFPSSGGTRGAEGRGSRAGGAGRADTAPRVALPASIDPKRRIARRAAGAARPVSRRSFRSAVITRARRWAGCAKTRDLLLGTPRPDLEPVITELVLPVLPIKLPLKVFVVNDNRFLSVIGRHALSGGLGR